MRISRVFTERALEPGAVVDLEERSAHYLARVLRLRPGYSLVLFNGDGFDYAAEVADSRCRECSIVARVPAVPESPLAITLMQAVGKGDRMDYCVQKATELGVAEIQPLFTERTEVRLQGKRLDRRMTHWHGVIIAACEQSGRAVVPVLHPPLPLQEGLAGIAVESRLVLDPEAESNLAGININQDGVAIIVGPEGGFSEQEMQQISQSGWTAARIGPRVLRTETAGPAAIAVLQGLAGDFR